MTMSRENTMNDDDDESPSACNGWLRKALKASSIHIVFLKKENTEFYEIVFNIIISNYKSINFDFKNSSKGGCFAE